MEIVIPNEYKGQKISFSKRGDGTWICYAAKTVNNIVGFSAVESDTQENAWLAMKKYLDTSALK
jgi:hypothetical protein